MLSSSLIGGLNGNKLSPPGSATVCLHMCVCACLSNLLVCVLCMIFTCGTHLGILGMVGEDASTFFFVKNGFLTNFSLYRNCKFVATCRHNQVFLVYGNPKV